MPVVTPSRASTEIVYAVRIRSLLCGVISGISSRSSIVGRHRHADHPAGVADRERHQLRRRLGGREDEVALVLAVLVVDDHDGLARGDVGDRRARRCPAGPAGRSTPTFSRSGVFEDSPFGVEAARAAGMQVIALPDPAMDRARYTKADAVVAGFEELHPDALGF